ncbi:acyltransferase domain-containing protein, partial [Amycolatopsis sp. SID8362]|uniref:acyltransferase domain-containing protein n=1 Tax=Amycolatopsis sp. SID8362 TaxID=2690346 RepID=UPI00136C99E9
GGMMSVSLPAADVEARIAPYGDGVSVAAINGPRSVVVAGDPAALAALLAELTGEGVRARRIDVDYASHSAQVEQLEGELRSRLAAVRPRAADIPFFSTVTGDWLDTTAMDAGYWYRNLRATVRFEPAIRELLAVGFQAFVEVSSHPVLTVGVQDIVEEAGARAVVTGTLRRDEGGTDRFLTSLAELHVRGIRPDWEAVFAGTGARRIALPTYAFQREFYWPDPEQAGPADAAGAEDAGFWAAVDSEDFDALAARLEVDGAALTEVLPA